MESRLRSDWSRVKTEGRTPPWVGRTGVGRRRLAHRASPWPCQNRRRCFLRSCRSGPRTRLVATTWRCRRRCTSARWPVRT